MATKTEGRNWSPSLSQRMLAILAASVIAVSAPAALVFYWFSREASIAESEQFQEASADRRVLGLQYTLRLAETSLPRFELLLRDAAVVPPEPGEPPPLDSLVRSNGGMLVVPPAQSPDAVRAEIFIDPRYPGDAAFQRLHLRAQRLITIFAGAVVPPLDSLWLLTRSRSGVIYAPRNPHFIDRIDTQRSYLETQWLTLGDPAVNPARALRWTTPAYDPVLEDWLVSAIMPLDFDGAWLGTIGHDLYLANLTDRLIGPGDLPGTQHFLIDAAGEPIIAGPWQAMFQANRLAPEARAEFDRAVAVLQAAAAGSTDRMASIHLQLNGVPVSAVMRDIPETGWRYFVVTPIAAMAGSAARALMLFGLTASLAVLLVAAVTHVLVRRQIVAPVRELAGIVRGFSAGDTGARAAFARDDDIGDLGRAFNAMADRITAAHDDLTVTQEELQHRNAALVHANRTKSNFLANMSHELRTPLNAIIGFAEILRHEMFGPLGSERYAGYVEDIQRSGQHLLSLINDILDMSKIEAGRQPMKLEQQSLRPLVERALRMAQPMAEHRSVHLDFTCGAGDLGANCDSRAVIQMVVNLVSNAVKFSPNGGTVRIRLEPSGFGGAKISVADNGPGIDESVLPHLFEAYAHRAAMTTSRYDGVGLGLAITKALVELHHGSIRVTTQPGRGTTMILELPPTIP